VKCGKNKLSLSCTFKVCLQKKTILKKKVGRNAEYGDHKQKKIVKGDLFLLTYFLIDD